MMVRRWLKSAFMSLLLLSAVPASAQSPSVVPGIRVDPNNQRQPKVVGLRPAEIRRAYGFNKIANQGSGQTIAIVSAFDTPTIENDLAVFSTTFALPPCTTGNGCFTKVGNPPPPDPTIFPPAVVELFQLETALDVEWAHAMAPQARIVLVQATNAFLSNMLLAVDEAVRNQHASVVSMSWGLPDTRDRSGDYQFVSPGVSFVAASGDFGHPGFWPAASADVTAVGGTKLNTTSKGDYNSEHSWADSGGGLSVFSNALTIQTAFTPNNPLGKRGVPDVAYNADPNTGVAVYSSLLGGWAQVGGTSVGAPHWSALIAIVNSIRRAAGKPILSGANVPLYLAAHSGGFNDISSGPKNGPCGAQCQAGPGYDYVTGLGSPKANVLIPALVGLSLP
jgi:subtilase family serine protease